MVQVSCRYVIQVLRYDKIFTPHFMDIYLIEHVYGATVSMGNLKDKNSSILAYNSGLEQDMKFKLSPLLFLSLKITPVYLSCAFYMISILVGIATISYLSTSSWL